MLSLPGYQVLAKIYESPNTLVYRGRREQDGQPVILKLLNKDYPSAEELANHQQEYELTRSLNLTGVVQAYSLEKQNNTPIAILEDFGGESLKILMNSQKFTILGFLTIAIKVAETLGELHANHVIHKDINPSNIVFNPATGQLKLIDFSISSFRKDDNPSEDTLSGLEGTLAYMSPEQTGRTNRTLDRRSDFYSLGVTFYELLTHQLPFETTDPMEMVHCHLAIEPVAPHERQRDISKAVSDIAMKLLAKNPDDRYQSAWGLKADLEECLSQVRSQGYIQDFPLGKFDISDKFQIPEKLYGRQSEIESFLNAFDRILQGQTEMILVGGYSGIGKSALVSEIHRKLTRKRGYFISGKFDQFQRYIPYSAIVTAFSELVGQLLTESEAELEKWRKKLLAAFGANGQIIIDVIPEVELIVGSQPPVQELGLTESQNRFNFVFQNFIRVFCAPEHPLIVFLDDLQWADSATLKLIKLMMTDEQTRYLFAIGAYRDNEVSSTHPLMITLDELRKEGATINQMTLTPLGREQVTQLLSETLHRDGESVQSLAELVVRKTQGNPFFVNQFLKTLYQENLLAFNPEAGGNNIGGWEWDMEKIRAVGITDNVVELMIGKLRKLPEATQEVLRLGACLGNQFDLNTLSLIYNKESFGTFADLSPAIKEGLILPIAEGEDEAIAPESINPLLILNYKFLHDRVQQAAYSLIEDAQKKAVHLQIGRMLLTNTPAQYWAERIFELVDHLNVGRSLISEPAEKLELASLNLEAAKKAKYATAYVAARQYLIAGMEGLPANIWDRDYEVAIALHKERALVEYLTGNFEGSERYIYLTLEQAKTVLEKAEIYNLLLVQYALSGEYEQAVKIGKEALAMLDIELPAEGLSDAIATEFAAAKAKWAGKDIASLIESEEMTLPEKKVALKLLTNVAPPAYLSDPQLWTAIVLKGVNISLDYGSIPESCLSYTNYGLLLSSVFGEYKSAYEFGLLALNLIEKWGNYELKAKACAGFANALSYWFNHIKEANQLNREGYQAALESGDLEYAGYLLHNRALNSFFQGENLAQLSEETAQALHFTQKTKNQLSSEICGGVQLLVGNLRKLTPDPLTFQVEEMAESEYIERCQKTQNFYTLCIYLIRKLQILYLSGCFTEAFECISDIEKYLPFITGTLPATEYNFYHSLLLTALYPEASGEEKKHYLQQLEANQQQMNLWAENCPSNFEHKYRLVNAEIARIEGREEAALDEYDRAIDAARENQFIQNEALANELAGKFWLQRQKQKYAQVHLREAYYGYERWGATRKVEQLEARYPQFLTKIPGPSGVIDTRTTAIRTTTDNGTNVLDIASVMKASQAISGEIVLDKLLANLMKILIENAGAQKGFLILPEEGTLRIAAEASVGTEEVVVEQYNSGVVEWRSLQSHELPVTAINYVERTRADVVLSDAANEGRFTADPYIAAENVKSVLCMPIVNQGKPIAILYLENNLTTGAFTPDRLEILRLLSSQAAISLENALLYSSVEQKVQERTQELNEKNLRLEQTLHELQRTQAQLVQSEKMSGLGQMVAGVAHEINNPVSFIYGNLTPASEYVQDLLHLIEVYQQEYPNPTPSVSETLEDIELDFLIEDLQKLLNSMKGGAERIRNIVLSLRNFSRHDEADMKPVDIHQGIDSTLMILQPKLRQEGGRYEIEVTKNYGKLPPVTCYASQLNQVFLNILSNAIYALHDFMRREENNEQNLPASPTIRIQTETTNEGSVKISIADNGPGMNQEVLNKVFDPFFTTKPVGSGTGLGLSTSYQTVVDAHGGHLSCVSQPGEGAEFIIEIPVKPRMHSA
ncbi:trifunctional serine/threonine-protein kinase/ATP-binding protein/sensor histidine kinase [Phormidium sp. CCY1219]|uniref:trifunctional serine/threonine-protein kinase/ATP-binding protein/sensor histidine kinase n=1 Tax=Phormidium sp. CCY1219 TaxID=2886104 RepID=UPI002D1F0C92|nr:AAA family ATPase [Phormidium sp. CCY1219]MEB3827534.1 AAA family ATPase [Phormidium sp. CCY1219]